MAETFSPVRPRVRYGISFLRSAGESADHAWGPAPMTIPLAIASLMNSRRFTALNANSRTASGEADSFSDFVRICIKLPFVNGTFALLEEVCNMDVRAHTERGHSCSVRREHGPGLFRKLLLSRKLLRTGMSALRDHSSTTKT